MGIILAPLYLLGIGFYILFYRTLRKENLSVSVSLLFVFIAMLPFTYDIIITNVLSTYYCQQGINHQNTRALERPHSIYFEDNIYPGFNQDDRLLMVKKYLGRELLETIALNGDDGNIYLYTTEHNQTSASVKEDIQKQQQNLRSKRKELYKERDLLAQREKHLSYEMKMSYKEPSQLLEINSYNEDGLFESYWVVKTAAIKSLNRKIEVIEQQINTMRSADVTAYINRVNNALKGVKTYTKSTMPKMQYTIEFDINKLNTFSNHFLFSTKRTVIDPKTGKPILSETDYMRFFYNIEPTFLGSDLNHYYSSVVCENGDIKESVFEKYRWVRHKKETNVRLSERYK